MVSLNVKQSKTTKQLQPETLYNCHQISASLKPSCCPPGGRHIVKPVHELWSVFAPVRRICCAAAVCSCPLSFWLCLCYELQLRTERKSEARRRPVGCKRGNSRSVRASLKLTQHIDSDSLPPAPVFSPPVFQCRTFAPLIYSPSPPLFSLSVHLFVLLSHLLVLRVSSGLASVTPGKICRRGQDFLSLNEKINVCLCFCHRDEMTSSHWRILTKWAWSKITAWGSV